MLWMALTAATLFGAAGDPASPPTPATTVITVCNGMAGPIGGVSLESTGDSGPRVSLSDLAKGACAALPAVAPGDYVLRTIEISGEHAMLCSRAVTVKGDETLHIAPGDGSSCIM